MYIYPSYIYIYFLSFPPFLSRPESGCELPPLVRNFVFIPLPISKFFLSFARLFGDKSIFPLIFLDLPSENKTMGCIFSIQGFFLSQFLSAKSHFYLTPLLGKWKMLITADTSSVSGISLHQNN